MAMVLLGAPGSLCAVPDPFLKTSGLDVRNDSGQGDVVPLRGVNLGSWLLMEPWMCPMDSSGNLDDDWSVRDTLTQRFGAQTKDSLIDAYQDAWLQEADFDNIAALGMNCVRLPFWYLNVQEEDGTWRADAFDRMDWAVSNAWARGIYTIIDLHGAPGGQRANADTTGRIWPTAALWTSGAYQTRTLEIWQKVSEHFNGNPAVAGYDLLNEPMDTPSSSAYWSFMNACYQTVRTNDPDHIIIMEATYGSWNLSMLPNPASYGWTNVVYQFHHYPWDDWYDVSQLNASADAKVQDWVNHSGWNVPCHMGEFNMGAEAGWKYAIEKYSSSGMSWQMWAYKATGGTTSWGVYNVSGGAPSVPNIQNNSSASINSKWSQWTTAGAFSLNQSHKRTLSMPVANDDAYTLDTGAVLTVAATGVLSNDTHLNLGGSGIELQAVKMSDPAYGSVVLNSNGSFTYTANVGFSGLDAFRYKIWDGRIDSVRNATVSIQVVSNSVAGPVTQLVWTTQPGLATNGLPFAQQPVLQTADQYGTPSTNGLPATLGVTVLQSAGTGPLAGLTNLNIGTAGWQGVIQFVDLQINSAGSNNQLRAETPVMTNPPSGNLLLNGNFNSPGSTAPPDNWQPWTFGGGWANHEIPTTGANTGNYDGTYQMSVGGFENAGGGVYQVVPASAGVEYSLTVDGGAQAWWLPTGEIRLFFLGGTNVLSSTVIKTTDSIHAPDVYDAGVAYQSWGLNAIAPVGTTHAKVEFANPVGTGTAWFDNAVLLSGQVSAPVLASATTLPFTVQAYVPPTSPTNRIVGITGMGGGAYSLQFIGTPGVGYYVEAATNLVPPVLWAPIVGSTNTVAATNGVWSHIVTNNALQRFYRSATLSP
jgi:aryl-phospho-beta-D-glucosidase BglC (GH1 family)